MSAYTQFRLYRYQLLPIDRHTDDLYLGKSSAEVVEQKNDIFAKAMVFVGEYRHAGTRLHAEVSSTNVDAFILRVAPWRPLMRELPNYQLEQVENWPHVTAIVLNRPNEQYIAVQEKAAAFANTDTVIKVIQKATRVPLERAGLRLHIESMSRENAFWDLVDEFGDRITWVGFEFITPNMANISKNLEQVLNKVSKDTNAVKGDLQLRSDADASLNLSRKNETVKGLAEYTSEGGGDITVKVRGIRKRYHTSNSHRTVELNGLELNVPADQVANILREILK